MRKKSNTWEANPVIVKELRSRMRGGRAFATLTGILLSLGLFSYSLYRLVIVASRYSTMPVSPQIGQTLFGGLVFLELLIVSALAPSITAGAISSEKERLTYEMLLATPLHPAKILWGKLISALGYVFLLIFAAIPMISLVFIYGGVTLREVIKAVLLLCIIAVLFGVVGLFFSSLFGRTGRATALTYLTVAMLLFGPLFAAGFTGVLRQSDPPRWMLIASPISAMGSAIAPSMRLDALMSMFWMLGNYQWVLGSTSISPDSIPRPIYHYSLPLFGGLTLILYLITTRLVLPARRWRIQFAEILVGLAIILGFLGIAALGFLGTTNRYENIRVLSSSTPSATEEAPADTSPPLKGP